MIINKYPHIKLLLRPHPAIKNKTLLIDYCIKNKIEYSDPIKTNSFDFLSSIDALIVGDSNIILEATLLNVFPLVAFKGKYFDSYGFLKNGLIENVYTNTEDLLLTIGNLIKNKPFVRSKAKNYSATINSIYDGKSSDLAYNLINQIIIDDIDYKEWERITDSFNIEAYQLRETY